MLPTSSALRSNVSAAMVGPPVGHRIPLGHRGPRRAPHPPKRSERPGEAVALLYQRHLQRHLDMGGLEGPPIPPNVRSAPAKPWRSSINATTISDTTGTTRRARGSGRRYLRRGSDRAGPDAWRAPAASP